VRERHHSEEDRLSVELRPGGAIIVAKLAVVAATVVILSMISGPRAQSSAMTPAVLAATTACGSSCTSPVNQGLGTGETPTITITGSGCPSVTAAGLESAAGDSSCTISVAMATASAANAGQDWVAMEEGTVDKFITDQALSQRLDIQYGSDEVVEFEAAPDGVASNLCLAVVSGKATLQPCGGATSVQTDTQTGSQTDKSSGTNTGSDSTSYNMFDWCCQPNVGGNLPYYYVTTGSDDTSSGSNTSTGTTTSTGTDTTITSTYSETAWILDTGNTSNGYLDVINGSDQAYSDPLVLTAASDGSLGLSSLSEIAGVVTTTQMWAFQYASASTATLKKEGVHRT
jgi:hypothetical protein